MNNSTSEKVIIGCVEKVKFPSLDGMVLHARIDTGARFSSIWALSVDETSEGLQVEFPANHEGTSSFIHVFESYEFTRISSSMGQEQDRFKVKIPVIIKKRRILATFTLADRSLQVYPVLIGRSALMHKFIVDVSKGSPLKDREMQKIRALESKIRNPMA